MKKLIILIMVMFIFALGSGVGAAAEIYVNPTESIQIAVNNAGSGDAIIVRPGTYTENIQQGRFTGTGRSHNRNHLS